MPCKILCKSSADKHKKSEMHRGSVELETAARLSSEGCGIAGAFGKQEAIDWTALSHAVRAISWLMKRELPHVTTYPALVELLKLCDAPYTSQLHKVRQPLCNTRI